MKKQNVEEILRQLTFAIDEEVEKAEAVCYKEEDGYHCTRGEGHTGQHIATGFRWIFKIWENKPF